MVRPFAALRNECSGEASSKDEQGARSVPSRLVRCLVNRRRYGQDAIQKARKCPASFPISQDMRKVEATIRQCGPDGVSCAVPDASAASITFFDCRTSMLMLDEPDHRRLRFSYVERNRQ